MESSHLIPILLLSLFLLALLVIPRFRKPKILARQIITPFQTVYQLVAPKRQIGELSVEANEVSVRVTSANVNVRREGEGSRITVHAKYSGDWTVASNEIVQSREPGAHLLTTEGANLTLVGLFGSKQETIDKSRVEIGDNDIKLDGKKIDLIFESDEADIIVPTNYRGGLKIITQGTGDVSLSDWTSGNVALESQASGRITAGNLLGLGSLSMKLAGSGDGQLGNIKAVGAITMQSERNGNITVGDLSNCESLTLNLLGTGDAQLGTVMATGAVSVLSRQNGHVTAGQISAGGALEIRMASGNINARDLLNSKSFSLHLEGSGDARLGNITTVGPATLVSDRNGGITVGDLPNCQLLSLNLHGTGDAQLGNITASGAVSMQSDQNGHITAGYITAGGSVEIRQTNGNLNARDLNHCQDLTLVLAGSGDASLGTITAAGAVSLLSDRNGKITVGQISAEGPVEIRQSTGNLNARDLLKCGSLTLKLRGSGDAELGTITAAGAVSFLSDQNGHITVGEMSADGPVEIRQCNGNLSARDLLKCGLLTLQLRGSGDARLGTITTTGAVSMQSNANGKITAGDLRSCESLALHLAGTGDAELGTINATGPVSMQSDANGQITAGHVTAGKAVKIALRNGNLAAGEIRAAGGSLELTANGSGDVRVDSVSAGIGTLSFVRGSRSNFSARRLDIGDLTIESNGSGDIQLNAIAGLKCITTIGANCNVSASDVTVGMFRFTTTGTGNLSIDNMSASEVVDLNLKTGSNCTVTVSGTVVAGSLALDSAGSGGTRIGTVRGGSFKASLSGRGGLNLDNLDVTAGSFCHQTSSGDAYFGRLKCNVLDADTTESGSLNIGFLDCAQASLSNSGRASVSVSDGKSADLKLSCQGTGNITVSGKHNVTGTQKSGRGTISIN